MLGGPWLLLALVCSAQAPHTCRQEVIATYPKPEWCESGVAFLDRFPQPRQIKVWCGYATDPRYVPEVHEPD